MTDVAEGAQRTASAVMYGGAGMSAGTGASVAVTEFLGLSMAQWQVVGIVSGIAIGVLGLVANTVISIYFKSAHLRLAREQRRADPEE